jgi:hypothetical protein
MGQTLARRGGVDEINIMVPLAMRQDRRLSNFVGWVASSPVVRCRAAAVPTVDRLVQDIAEQIRNAMPYMPADFTLEHGRLHDELLDRGSYLGLYLSGDVTLNLRTTSGWNLAQALKSLGDGNILNFGSFKLETVVPAGLLRETVNEFELRTYEKGDSLAVRCSYDQDVFTQTDALDIFDEILDRVDILYEKNQSDVLGPA